MSTSAPLFKRAAATSGARLLVGVRSAWDRREQNDVLREGLDGAGSGGPMLLLLTAKGTQPSAFRARRIS